MRQLCATVLFMEAIVIALAIPVAVTIAHTPARTSYLTGGIFAVIAVALATVVARPRQGWTLVAGSLLQACVIASGVIVPAMYGLGAIFGGLWATAIWLGHRYRDAPEP